MLGAFSSWYISAENVSYIFILSEQVSKYSISIYLTNFITTFKIFKMKKHMSLLYVVLVSLLFVCCNKDDSSKLDPEGDCFTAKVDGVLFESDNVIGNQVFASIAISATQGVTDVPTFALTLTATAEGTYSFDSPNLEVTSFYTPVAGLPNIYGATTGSLTIEEHDPAAKRIRGTFNYEGINGNGEAVQVTEGFFDLVYL